MLSELHVPCVMLYVLSWKSSGSSWGTSLYFTILNSLPFLCPAGSAVPGSEHPLGPGQGSQGVPGAAEEHGPTDSGTVVHRPARANTPPSPLPWAGVQSAEGTGLLGFLQNVTLRLIHDRQLKERKLQALLSTGHE